MPIGPFRRRISLLLLSALAGVVLWSGAACLLEKYERSLWPWHKAWYMFSWSDGYLHKLEVVGELKDSSSIKIDLDRWFQFPVAFDTRRSDEIPWTYDNFRALSLFAARRHNESASAGQQVVRISLNDVAWKCEPGTRQSYAETPEPRKIRRKLVDRLPCPAPESPNG